jgi:NADH:ubiquinone oxidoreductase subunit K
LNVWLALLVFSVSPKHLDTRLSVVVTLFLALTALLFVVNGNLPESSTVVPTQQACILAYFVLALIGIESIIVYQIVTTHRQRDIRRRTKHARGRFLRRMTKSSSKDADKAVRRAAVRDQRSVPAAPGPLPGAPLPGPPADERHQVGSADEGSASGEPRAAGLGVAVGTTSDSEPYGGASAGSSYDTSDGGSRRAGDEEAAWWDARRWGGRKPRATGQRGAEAAVKRSPRRPGWFVLQLMKVKEIRRESRRNPDFALWLALRLDMFVFWFVFIGFNAGLVILLAVQSTYQPNMDAIMA